MKYKYSSVEKRVIVGCYKDGKSVSCISQDTGIPRSIIYSWLKQDFGNCSNPKEFTRKNFLMLQKKVERLEGIIEILKNAECLPNAPLSTKLNALEKLHEQSRYSVHMLCEALDVSRGTFYNHILRNKREHTWYAERREELRESIQRIYDDNHQIFGAEKIAAVMKEEGCKVSVEMVRELMQEMGLTSIRQDAKSMYEKEQRKLKNQLNQQFNVSRPDEVWVSDVTYFRFNDNKFYICAIIDLFARKVISYKIGKSNSTQLVKCTFRAAYETRRPSQSLMFHTDRGTNYRAKTFCSYLKSLGVVQSFSNAHVPYDNSVMESFFSSLKREELYRTKYRSENEFRTALDKYMVFYNKQRPHASNKYKTPAQKEADFISK